MFYELATLSILQRAAASTGAAVLDYVSRPEAQGKALGLWQTGIGTLNQIVLLRQFDSRPSLAAERERARRSPDPFNCSEHLTGLDMTSFVPFDFFPGVETGPRGPLYEIRTYHLKPAGLSPLEARWRADAEAGMAEARTILAMYTMDGEPRLMEIRTLGEQFKKPSRAIQWVADISVLDRGFGRVADVRHKVVVAGAATFFSASLRDEARDRDA